VGNKTQSFPKVKRQTDDGVRRKGKEGFSPMNEQYAAMITGFPLFSGFTLQGAQMLLESGEVKQYRAGEVLLREGDAATFVLLVLTGTMRVFVERRHRDLVLNDVGPGTILGELAVLCGIPRSASIRAGENAAVLEWSATTFRSLLLRDVFLSERIFRESLRTLIEKERSLIDSLVRAQGGNN
jgi:CRP-like cAMP-binding protein